MALRITEEAMTVSDAEREANRRRQQAWRARHQGKPRGNKVLMAELAALRTRVAELEAAAAHRTPVVELTTPAHRLRAELAALRLVRRAVIRSGPACNDALLVAQEVRGNGCCHAGA